MKLIHWAITWWYPEIPNAHLVADWWSLKVTLWYSTRGFLWTISHIKNIRLHITRYICGNPLMVSQGHVRVGIKGLPRGLTPLTDLLSSKRGISFVLTLLNISRCLPGTKAPDLSTITSPWKGYIPYHLKEFIPEFGKMYSLTKFSSTFTLSDLANSNKSGPVGLSTPTSVLNADYALEKLGKDLVSLTGGSPKGFEVNGRFFQPLAPLLKPLDKWAPLSSKYRDILGSFFHGKNLDKVSFLRKLSIVNDPEGKARIICIFDYWSQQALKEVHNWAFSCLAAIPQDRTFDQDPMRIKKEGPYYSIDLTAATDRFPVELQQLLLESLSTSEIAQAWRNILTAHEVYVPWESKSIKYAVGQPMGAYSSWAIFALTHHLVVQYSAKMVGENLPFADYMLLGDDIVIANKAVAERYITTLDDLGVGISLHKTHVSLDTYEFAKRWIHKGVEVSGIPLRGLVSSWQKYHLLIPYLYHIIGHLPTSKFTSIAYLVRDLYLKMGRPERICNSIYNRATEFTAVWKYLKENDTSMILSNIKRTDSIWLPFPNAGTADAEEYLQWLLERTMVREIFATNESLKGFLTGMHKRWNKLLDEHLGDKPEVRDEIYSALLYHPQWQSLQAEQSRVSERTRDLIKNKKWLDLLKVVTIPDPEKILEDRSNVQLSQGVAKFARNVFKTAAMQRSKDVWFLQQFE